MSEEMIATALWQREHDNRIAPYLSENNGSKDPELPNKIDTDTKDNGKWYYLYVNLDSFAIKAVGPFESLAVCKAWAAGFNKCKFEEYVSIGMVHDDYFKPHQDVVFEKPE